MSCELILIRHGESLGNVKEVFLGHTDWGLTPLGREQAEALGRAASSFGITRCYSSDLIRAMDTVRPLSEALGLPITPSCALREIYAGRWEGMSFAEIERTYPEEKSVWSKTVGLSRPTGGESVKELQERILRELLRLGRENEGEVVAVGTHATPLRATVCHLLGLPLCEMQNVPWCPNASVTRILYKNGKLSLLCVGNVDHLAGLRPAHSLNGAI